MRFLFVSGEAEMIEIISEQKQGQAVQPDFHEGLGKTCIWAKMS